jgi:hypothetical protein
MGVSQDSPGVTLMGASETDREDALSDYVLPTLQIGGEKLSNFPVRIRKFKMTRFSTNGAGLLHFDANVDVMIGVDFLMLNRVYVARREHKMYFTPYTAEEKKAILDRRASN